MLKARADFVATMTKRFPEMASLDFTQLVSENLISPFEVKISKSVLQQAQDFAAALYKLRENPGYQKTLAAEFEQASIQDPKNKSIMMSYDFHLTSDQGLKLIEVNTNAAFLGLGLVLNESRGLANPVRDFSYSALKDSLAKEVELCFAGERKLNKVAIIDDKPSEQRLFVEFLMYQSLFRSWGLEVDIVDTADLKAENYDLIYNRDTDFLLGSERSRKLKIAFDQKQACLSPNPFEYILLADKQRMIDWQTLDLAQFGLDQVDIENIRQRLPSCESFLKQDPEKIWAQRKGLFFKPMRAFGSKQTFKGASISRKAFDEIKGQDFIAQEYVAAPEISNIYEGNEVKMKYDLRFYVYQNKVQNVVARLYQGQVTNLRTPLGGFAPVVVEN